MSQIFIYLLMSVLSASAEEDLKIHWSYAGCAPTPSECRNNYCFGHWIYVEKDRGLCDPEDLFMGGLACYCGVVVNTHEK